MSNMNLEDWLKAAGPIPPMTDEPFGINRTDPDLVRGEDFSYVFDECDTCGREFAYKRYMNISYRNCCPMCSSIWDKYSGLRSSDKKNRLFFYRVKAVRDLKDLFKDEIRYTSYSTLELDILGILKGGEKRSNYKGDSITDMVKKLFGVEYTDSGMIKGYSNVHAACKSLISKGLVRKYTEVARSIGRPQVRYKLTKKVWVVKKKCPNCGNNKYWIDNDERTFNCIYCNARWVIPK